MTGRKQIPVAEDYFVWPSTEAGLIAARCKSCETYYFPKTFLCHNPKCKERIVEETVIKGQGKLWSYTTLHYIPPFPYVSVGDGFPIYIGLVEFPEGIRIMGQLTGVEENHLSIDMDVELIIEKLFNDDDGNDVMTWKFKPI